ncbi:MAG: methylated-DNA--[Oscillospiraceae bacterium]|nr:methylated-DNA--[protein]-cysteine S-methyltransferase [Oscillospiraceae bacterium]
MKTCTAHVPSPLGELLLVSDGEALCGLYFEGQRYYPALPEAEERPELSVFEKTRAWLRAYFAGERPETDVPLHPDGTAFQRAVWELLREIPYGETVSYGTLADMLAAHRGRPCSARAVGGAVGRNPVSILVPCHRVVGADGSLTGYAGGTDRKRKLLEIERGAR